MTVPDFTDKTGATFLAEFLRREYVTERLFNGVTVEVKEQND
jgi:hypothetical protein